MSGICGIWLGDNRDLVEATLAKVSGGLSLVAHERQERKTDLQAGAGVGVSVRFPTQQIYSTPHLLLVCDADLLNESDLRERTGFLRNSGTAQLLAGLYDQLGPAFVEKLRGAFSVIIWDRRNRQFLAAIDGFGMRRLVYYKNRDVLLIGSRIDALVQSGEIARDVDPTAIINILNFSSNLAPGTIYRKVKRLQPGSYLLASESGFRIHQYWDMAYGTGRDNNEKRLAQKLEAIVEQSVAKHCSGHSDSVGAFLSGGTDSSTVVGMMTRTGQKPTKTFSIGFQEQPFNELGFAEIAARQFKTQHRTYLVGPQDCFDALPSIIRAFDEPFGNSSAIPTYFCTRLAADSGVRLLLGGDGGDELFGGNEWYATDRIFQLYQKLPGLLRTRLLEPLLAAVPLRNGVVGRARRYVRRSNLPPLERVLSYHFVCANAPSEIFEEACLKSLSTYSVTDIPSHYYAHAPTADHLDRLLYVDVKTILGDSDLPKVTCMAELAGTQARFPFLDRDVAEFSGSIPPRLKVKGFEKRYLFKRAFRDLLPYEIIHKKKHGFGIPVAEWMKTHPRMRQLSHDTLLSTRASQRGYFKRSFVEELFRKHELEESPYYGDTLWTFLAIELWHREFADAPLGIAA